MADVESFDSEAASGFRRGNVIQWALLEARTRHDRCESLDLRAGTSDISGSHFLYCGLCGQKLLEWGGDA